MSFTQNAKYTLPYLAGVRSPVILLCFLIIGNMFPVTDLESKGQPISSGYQSHYVITNPKGEISTNYVGCSEVIVSQESQVFFY